MTTHGLLVASGERARENLRSALAKGQVQGGHAPAFLPAMHWLALLPTLLAMGVFVYGFVAWTGAISLSASRMVPDMTFVGLQNFAKLWKLEIWTVATFNLVVFSTFYIGISMALGLMMALLLDQVRRGEAVVRTFFLYPAALSFVVTGLVWKWLLNPGIGIEAFLQGIGLPNARFDWIINSKTVIFAIVAAAIWQVSGFVMALFLAGLRTVDEEIVKAARLDGAGVWRTYFSIVLPTIKPVFVSIFVLLLAFAVKTFDIVVTMTAGGPGYSSTMPATFMYEMAFHRNQLGLSAASAMTILVFSMIVVGPYLLAGLRRRGSSS